MKPDYNEQRDTELQSSLVNPSYEFSSQDNQKQFTTHSLYQNTLQDVVASGLIGSTKECILHPTSGNHSTALHFNNFNAWIRKPTENPIRGVMSWFLIQGRGPKSWGLFQVMLILRAYLCLFHQIGHLNSTVRGLQKHMNLSVWNQRMAFPKSLMMIQKFPGKVICVHCQYHQF